MLITGAIRGIGLAIATRVARDGANVHILAKTTEPHPKLPRTIFTAVAEVEAAAARALLIAVDLRNDAAVEAAANREYFGGVDACVNNANALSLTNTVGWILTSF